MRSTGRQVRSRDRVELLLTEAATLIAESGIDGLKMRELARRADLPIASVYHYFPSASAVLRELAVRHLDDLTGFLAEKLTQIDFHGQSDKTRADIAGQLVRDVAAHLLRSQAATSAIWDSLRANPELRALDMSDTIRNAALLEPFVAWVVPALPDAKLPDTTLVLLEAIQGNLLVITRSPPARIPVLVDRLAELVVATLRGLQIARP